MVSVKLILKAPVALLFTIYNITAVFGFAAVLEVFQVTFYLLYRAHIMSDHAFTSFSTTMLGWWVAYARFTLRYLCRQELRITGDDIEPGQRAFLISNHASYLETVFVFILASHCNRGGHLRLYAKDAIRYYPIVWGVNLLDFILLKRDFEKDRPIIEKQLRRLQRFDDLGFWIGVFPEGSRFTEGKAEKSRVWAKKEGLAGDWKHVLVPRVKAFEMTLEQMRTSFDYVYSATFAYEHQPASLLWLLGGMDKNVVHVHVKKTPVSAVPESREGMKDWLMDDFRRMDGLLEGYAKNGRFPGKPRASMCTGASNNSSSSHAAVSHALPADKGKQVSDANQNAEKSVPRKTRARKAD